MAQQFQVNRNKSPGGVSKNRIEHEKGLSWVKAYLPPFFIAGQGLALCSVLILQKSDIQMPMVWSAFSLASFLFSVYLFEGMGLLSPEDRVNQPLRWNFFRVHKHSAFFWILLSGLIGVLCFERSDLPVVRPFGSLLASGFGFGLYVFFRWKIFGLMKPFLVSLSWILALWGFSHVELNSHFPLYLTVFFLLFLDSLWLDLKDVKGDAAYGFNVRHFANHPRRTLSLGHLALFFFIAGTFSWSHPLQFANGLLWACGYFSVSRATRFQYALLILLWSYLLGLINLWASGLV